MSTESTERFKGTGPKRTKPERLRDIAEIADKLLDGWTQREIADWISANRPYRLGKTTVLNDCRAAEAIWMERAAEAIERRKARELAKLEKLERDARRGWESS